MVAQGMGSLACIVCCLRGVRDGGMYTGYQDPFKLSFYFSSRGRSALGTLEDA